MKFFIPGGASSPWLVERHLDEPLDLDYVQTDLKSMLGSGAITVFDETVDPLRRSRGGSRSSSRTSRAASALRAVRGPAGSRRSCTGWCTARGDRRISTCS